LSQQKRRMVYRTRIPQERKTEKDRGGCGFAKEAADARLDGFLAAHGPGFAGRVRKKRARRLEAQRKALFVLVARLHLAPDSNAGVFRRRLSRSRKGEGGVVP
jgi:hypothetical protein